jgi:hypothetical protein
MTVLLRTPSVPPKELAKYLKISFSHVAELKPKPGAKKKTAGKR